VVATSILQFAASSGRQDERMYWQLRITLIMVTRNALHIMRLRGIYINRVANPLI